MSDELTKKNNTDLENNNETPAAVDKKAKKTKPLVRLPAIIVIVVLTAATVLFSIFFADSILKSIIEKGMSTASGNQVKIARVDSSLIKGEISIYKMVVTEKTKNRDKLFTIEKAAFKVNVFEFFVGKVNIKTIEVSGLSFYKFAEPKKENNTTDEQNKKISDPNEISKAKEVLQSGPQLPGDNVMKEKVANMTAPITERTVTFQSNVSSLKKTFDNSANLLIDKKKQENNLTTIRSIDPNKYKTVQDIPKLEADIKRLEAIQNETKKDIQNATQLKSEFEGKSQYFITEANEIKKLSKIGFKGALDELGVGNPAAIASLLIGEDKVDKIVGIQSFIEKFGKLLPKGKDKNAKNNLKKGYDKGTTVWFNNEEKLPGFLIENIIFSGDFNSPFKNAVKSKDVTNTRLAITGNISSVSSDLNWKPVEAVLAGNYEEAKLAGEIEISKNENEALKSSNKDLAVSTSLEAIKIDLVKLGFIESEYLKSAIGDLKITSSPDLTKVDAVIYTPDFVLPKEKSSPLLEKALKKIDSFELKYTMTKKGEDTVTSFETDLIPKIEKILKEITGEEMKKWLAKADVLYKKELSNVLGKLGVEEKKFTEIQNKILENGKSADGAAKLVEEKKALLEKKIASIRAEQEKKATEAVTKQIPTDKIPTKSLPTGKLPIGK